MRILLLTIIGCMIAASAAHAFEMGLPVDCSMGSDCYIRSYVDHSPKDGLSDYTCGTLSYNGNSGTDFAVRSYALYEKGVTVLAAAGGTVTASFDLLPDGHAKTMRRKLIKKRKCGNMVVVDHGTGWKTTYCHLKQGSVKVNKGDEVITGQPLGQVGMSGNTEYPHLHMLVRKNSRYYDPFTARDKDAPCSVSPQRESLWESSVQKKLIYKPSGHIGAGFNDVQPDQNNVVTRIQAKETLSYGADGIYFWTSFYGVKSGDNVHVKLISPSGVVVARDKLFIQEALPRIYKYIGLENHGLLEKGIYLGKTTLLRSGSVIAKHTEKVQVK